MVIFFANFYLTKIDARGKSIHNFQLLRTTPTISNFYVARIAFTSVRKGTQFDQLELHVPKIKFTTKLFAVHSVPWHVEWLGPHTTDHNQMWKFLLIAFHQDITHAGGSTSEGRIEGENGDISGLVSFYLSDILQL